MFQKSKFKDDPPTAIDYFKATHCSSKTGYSEDAQKAIVSTSSCLLCTMMDKNWNVRNLTCFFSMLG